MKYNCHFFLQTRLLENKFPIDILYNINNILMKNYINRKKWLKITNKVIYDKCEIIDYIHTFHNYAVNIHELSHLLFDNNYHYIGLKFIKVGKNIHKLCENMIKYVIDNYNFARQIGQVNL